MNRGCEKNNKNHQEKDADDEASSTDTSSVCSLSESIQLSLPDSFGDAFSVNGISIAPDKCTKAEVHLLHARLLESTRQVQQLCDDRDASLRVLKNLEVKSIEEEEYHRIKQIPSQNRSLAQSATIILYDKINSHQHEIQIALKKAKNSLDISEQQKQKASNVQILCEQRLDHLQESLDASSERRRELEDKCNTLQATIIEIQEKGRKFDDLSSQSKDMENDIKRLQELIDKQQKEMESRNIENMDMKRKMKDVERNNHSLQMDKSFMEKEKIVLLQRAETAEERTKNIESTLRQTATRCDDLTIQLGNANLNAKTECETKAAIEIKRIREKSEDEIKRYRSQVESSYTREINILREAKSEAVKENVDIKNEIKTLRTNLGNIIAQKDESLNSLQREISECRSDIKVKCIENSRVKLYNEKLEQSKKALQCQVQMLSDQVEVHRNEFTNLEQESLHLRKQLTDEVERKEEQLEIYYQSQINSSKNKGAQSIAPCSSQINQIHFLEKAKQLEKKNSDLQKALAHLKHEFNKQTESAKNLQLKLKSADSQIQSLLEQTKVYEEKQAREDGASNYLMNLNQSFKEDLLQARNERDKIAKDFSSLLEKYHHIVERRENVGGYIASPLPIRPKNNVQFWTVDKNMMSKKVTPSKRTTRSSDSIAMHTTHQASTRH